MPLEYIRDEIVFDGKYIQAIRRHYLTRSGKAGVWEMVQRKGPGRIVAVLAVTPRHEAILLKTYRVPLRSYMIETCVGLMEAADESEEAAARRELLEETGYTVTALQRLFAGPFNPGMHAGEMVFFLGLNAVKAQEPQLEDSEDIEVLRVPLRQVPEFLAVPPAGCAVDPKLYGVFYFLHRLQSEL